MYVCVKINEKDNVATVTKAIVKEDKILYKFKGIESEILATTNVPIYHKIALSDIKKGEVVTKYGCKIGYALQDIKTGEHVHTNNLDSMMS